MTIPISGTQCSQLGNKMFPGWEPNISKLGTYFALLMAIFAAFAGTFCNVCNNNLSISQQISRNPHKHRGFWR